MSSAALEPLAQVTAFLNRRHTSFIDGAPVAEHAGEVVEVFNPATGAPLSQLLMGGEAQVEQAVASAHRAFRSGVWSGLRPADRERILLRFAALVEEHGEELAQLETLNQGKSINTSRMLDVGASVEFMRYMAGWATKIEGATHDVSVPFIPQAKFFAWTRREAAGVGSLDPVGADQHLLRRGEELRGRFADELASGHVHGGLRGVGERFETRFRARPSAGTRRRTGRRSRDGRARPP